MWEMFSQAILLPISAFFSPYSGFLLSWLLCFTSVALCSFPQSFSLTPTASEALSSVQKWNSWLKGCLQQFLMRKRGSDELYAVVKDEFLKFLDAQHLNCWYYHGLQPLITFSFQHSAFSDKLMLSQPQTHTPALSLSSPLRSLLLFLSLSSAHWYKYTKMWPDR